MGKYERGDNMEIAAFLDENNRTTSIDKCGTIKIYSNTDGTWKEIKQIKYEADSNANMKLMREKLYKLVEMMDECKIFVGLQVSGILYNVLENAGFNVWEIEGTPIEFLDYVFSQEEEEEISKNVKADELNLIPYPEQTEIAGCYTIDLKKIQKSNVNFTTKQILLPFLKNSVFYQLEIICSHIPGWFEREFDRLDLKQDVIHEGMNECKVIVYKKTCTGN